VSGRIEENENKRRLSVKKIRIQEMLIKAEYNIGKSNT